MAPFFKFNSFFVFRGPDAEFSLFGQQTVAMMALCCKAPCGWKMKK
jgi:hypothetical protein